MLHYVHKIENHSLEKIIGLFMFLALGILLIVFFNIENRENFFGGLYKIHILFNRGFGLREGSPVDLAGVGVGNIESIRFNEQNKVDVTAGIKNKYKEKIRADSIATVISQGLMGNAAISISIGSISMPVVEDGGYIDGIGISKTDGIMSGIKPILMKANEAIDNIIFLTSISEKPIVRIDHLLENLDKLSEEIKAGEGNIGALLKDQVLYSNLIDMVGTSERLLSSMDKTVKNIELASQLLPEVINNAELSLMEINKSAEKMPILLSDGQELIANIKSSSNEFNKLIRDSNKQITRVSYILKDFKTATTDLPELIKGSQKNLDEITRIIEGAEKNWIVKGFLERKKKEAALIVDVRDGHYDETIEKKDNH